MRFKGLIPALAFVFFSSAASAQDWDVYTNRDNFFSVNFPGDPAVTQIQYKTLKGTTLQARVFTAVAPAGSILSGTYTVTVVDYSNAKDEFTTADDQARKAAQAKGTVKYDEINNVDLHLTRRLTVETGRERILTEILGAANYRLYITEARTALNVPPPAQFQASLQILDEKGVRIRERTALGVPEDVKSPISAGGVVDETEKFAGAATGTWRVAGGSCDAAYFKTTGRSKTKRNEPALDGTVSNRGVTFTGQLVLNGSRAGQFINPMTDKAIMLFDTKPGKLDVLPIDAPATGWPDATLELCPGTRG
jgi:hypothetical protein